MANRLRGALGNDHYAGMAPGWVFLALMGCMNLFRGATHLLTADGGAERIAGNQVGDAEGAGNAHQFLRMKLREEVGDENIARHRGRRRPPHAQGLDEDLLDAAPMGQKAADLDEGAGDDTGEQRRVFREDAHPGAVILNDDVDDVATRRVRVGGGHTGNHNHLVEPVRHEVPVVVADDIGDRPGHRMLHRRAGRGHRRRGAQQQTAGKIRAPVHRPAVPRALPSPTSSTCRTHLTVATSASAPAGWDLL